jgi:hypothetical protein
LGYNALAARPRPGFELGGLLGALLLVLSKPLYSYIQSFLEKYTPLQVSFDGVSKGPPKADTKSDL